MVLKDGSGGIGWRPGGTSLDQNVAGLDDVMDIFARLNGKQETEEERMAKERRKAMRYVGQRIGTITFIRGGLLVQKDLEACVDEELRTPVETAEAIEGYELDLEAVDEKVKTGRKRKAESEPQTETDAGESDGRAGQKRRRKEEKAEKKRRKEERRRKQTENSSAGLAGPDPVQDTPASSEETLLAPNNQLRIVKEKDGVINSSTDSASEQQRLRKKSKRDRKLRKSSSKKEGLLASSPADSIGSAAELSPSLDDPEVATPRHHESSITKASSKNKKSKKESRSAPTSQISTPNATTGTSTPTRTGASTPLGGRHIHHAKRVAAKQAGVLDATALRQVRFIFVFVLPRRVIEVRRGHCQPQPVLYPELRRTSWLLLSCDFPRPPENASSTPQDILVPYHACSRSLEGGQDQRLPVHEPRSRPRR